MKTVTRFETRDGRLHTSRMDAKHHAENLYHLAVRTLTSQMVHLTKERDLHDFVDRYLADFVELAALKKDIEMERGGGDEDTIEEESEEDAERRLEGDVP